MDGKYSLKVTEILSLANEEALRLGNNYIAPEHIFLGMMRLGSGVAYDYLQEKKVDLSKNNNKITVGDSGDIQKFDDLDPERVFVRVYKDIVEEIVIIR